MILDVFDFDGTLWKNPLDTPENRKKFEKETGIPWIINKSLAQHLSKKYKKPIYPRQGWYGRIETLQPPLVPDPAPKDLLVTWVVEQFLKSKNDPNTHTILLTGRHKGLCSAVLRILGDLELVKVQKNKDSYQNVDEQVQVFCLGQIAPIVDDFKNYPPMPSETIKWKLWVIANFINQYVYEHVRVWEDRPEHASEFDIWLSSYISHEVFWCERRD